MKKRINLTILLYLLLLTFICSCIFIYYFEKKLGKELIDCAQNQVESLTTIVTNNSIKKYLLNHNPSYILRKETNQKGEITRITYNTNEINKTKTAITQILEKDLLEMTKGNMKNINLQLNTISKDYYEKINDGIIFTVSLGTATGNTLLANIGPKIPIKLKVIGKVITVLEPTIKEYGLNNALIELSLKTKCTTIIQMPFLSKKVTIENKIPLSIEILQGSIPEYHIGKSN